MFNEFLVWFHYKLKILNLVYTHILARDTNSVDAVMSPVNYWKSVNIFV